MRKTLSISILDPEKFQFINAAEQFCVENNLESVKRLLPYLDSIKDDLLSPPILKRVKSIEEKLEIKPHNNKLFRYSILKNKLNALKSKLIEEFETKTIEAASFLDWIEKAKSTLLELDSFVKTKKAKTTLLVGYNTESGEHKLKKRDDTEYLYPLHEDEWLEIFNMISPLMKICISPSSSNAAFQNNSDTSTDEIEASRRLFEQDSLNDNLKFLYFYLSGKSISSDTEPTQVLSWIMSELLNFETRYLIVPWSEDEDITAASTFLDSKFETVLETDDEGNTINKQRSVLEIIHKSFDKINPVKSRHNYIDPNSDKGEEVQRTFDITVNEFIMWAYDQYFQHTADEKTTLATIKKSLHDHTTDLGQDLINCDSAIIPSCINKAAEFLNSRSNNDFFTSISIQAKNKLEMSMTQLLKTEFDKLKFEQHKDPLLPSHGMRFQPVSMIYLDRHTQEYARNIILISLNLPPYRGQFGLQDQSFGLKPGTIQAFIEHIRDDLITLGKTHTTFNVISELTLANKVPGELCKALAKSTSTQDLTELQLQDGFESLKPFQVTNDFALFNSLKPYFSRTDRLGSITATKLLNYVASLPQEKAEPFIITFCTDLIELTQCENFLGESTLAHSFHVLATHYDVCLKTLMFNNEATWLLETCLPEKNINKNDVLQMIRASKGELLKAASEKYPFRFASICKEDPKILLNAILKGRLDILETITSAIPDSVFKEDPHKTKSFPLHVAIESKSISIIKHIADTYPDLSFLGKVIFTLNRGTRKEFTPFSLALDSEDPQIIRLCKTYLARESNQVAALQALTLKSQQYLDSRKPHEREILQAIIEPTSDGKPNYSLSSYLDILFQIKLNSKFTYDQSINLIKCMKDTMKNCDIDEVTLFANASTFFMTNIEETYPLFDIVEDNFTTKFSTHWVINAHILVTMCEGKPRLSDYVKDTLSALTDTLLNPNGQENMTCSTTLLERHKIESLKELIQIIEPIKDHEFIITLYNQILDGHFENLPQKLEQDPLILFMESITKKLFNRFEKQKGYITQFETTLQKLFDGTADIKRIDTDKSVMLNIAYLGKILTAASAHKSLLRTHDFSLEEKTVEALKTIVESHNTHFRTGAKHVNDRLVEGISAVLSSIPLHNENSLIFLVNSSFGQGLQVPPRVTKIIQSFIQSHDSLLTESSLPEIMSTMTTYFYNIGEKRNEIPSSEFHIINIMTETLSLIRDLNLIDPEMIHFLRERTLECSKNPNNTKRKESFSLLPKIYRLMPIIDQELLENDIRSFITLKSSEELKTLSELIELSDSRDHLSFEILLEKQGKNTRAITPTILRYALRHTQNIQLPDIFIRDTIKGYFLNFMKSNPKSAFDHVSLVLKDTTVDTIDTAKDILSKEIEFSNTLEEQDSYKKRIEFLLELPNEISKELLTHYYDEALCCYILFRQDFKQLLQDFSSLMKKFQSEETALEIMFNSEHLHERVDLNEIRLSIVCNFFNKLEPHLHQQSSIEKLVKFLSIEELLQHKQLSLPNEQPLLIKEVGRTFIETMIDRTILETSILQDPRIFKIDVLPLLSRINLPAQTYDSEQLLFDSTVPDIALAGRTISYIREREGDVETINTSGRALNNLLSSSLPLHIKSRLAEAHYHQLDIDTQLTLLFFNEIPESVSGLEPSQEMPLSSPSLLIGLCRAIGHTFNICPKEQLDVHLTNYSYEQHLERLDRVVQTLSYSDTDTTLCRATLLSISPAKMDVKKHINRISRLKVQQEREFTPLIFGVAMSIDESYSWAPQRFPEPLRKEMKQVRLKEVRALRTKLFLQSLELNGNREGELELVRSSFSPHILALESKAYQKDIAVPFLVSPGIIYQYVELNEPTILGSTPSSIDHVNSTVMNHFLEELFHSGNETELPSTYLKTIIDRLSKLTINIQNMKSNYFDSPTSRFILMKGLFMIRDTFKKSPMHIGKLSEEIDMKSIENLVKELVTKKYYNMISDTYHEGEFKLPPSVQRKLDAQYNPHLIYEAFLEASAYGLHYQLIVTKSLLEKGHATDALNLVRLDTSSFRSESSLAPEYSLSHSFWPLYCAFSDSNIDKMDPLDEETLKLFDTEMEIDPTQEVELEAILGKRNTGYDEEDDGAEESKGQDLEDTNDSNKKRKKI